MLEQVILNTKIDIKNVIFRLEDAITSKKKGSYVIEAGLKQLYVGNCDSEWESKDFQKEKSEFVRKVI